MEVATTRTLPRVGGPWPVVAAGLSGWLLLELVVAGPGSVDPRHVGWGLATTLPLALAGRWPRQAGIGVQAAYAVGALVVEQPELLSQGLATYFVATYVAASGAPSWRGALGCGLASMGLLALQGAWDTRYGNPGGAVLANLTFGAMAWAVAAVTRRHAARSSASRRDAAAVAEASEARALAAVQAERDRLAAELHDLVAHALSVTLLRARGAKHEEELAGMRVALRDIEELAGEALRDMRRLLEIVHGDEQVAELAPQPGLGDLPDLVRRLEGAGLRTTLQVEGTAPAVVGPAVQLSAYRVVQESLTNVLRHAHQAHAEVSLRWSPHRLEVVVRDSGPADPHPGTGQGLRGLAQRVDLFGGRFEAGPCAGGGFQVAASLPLTGVDPP